MLTPKRLVSNPLVNVMETDNQHDIDVLQHYEAPDMGSLPSHPVDSPLVEQKNMPKPQVQQSYDLIDLSDGDILSVGNLGWFTLLSLSLLPPLTIFYVSEINVPPLRLPTSKVKSGVDVFHEERARADRSKSPIPADRCHTC